MIIGAGEIGYPPIPCVAWRALGKFVISLLKNIISNDVFNIELTWGNRITVIPMVD
jgi:hypothetical protein